jgi:hypothetical protein
MTVEEAVARLRVQDDEMVHTFVVPAPMVLLGADWPLEEVKRVFEQHGVEQSGPNMTAMKHGLAVMRDDGPVFFETNERKVVPR